MAITGRKCGKSVAMVPVLTGNCAGRFALGWSLANTSGWMIAVLEL